MFQSAKVITLFVSIGLLTGCSAEQLASTRNAMQSINDGLKNASTFTTPPPSFYQPAPVIIQQTPDNNQIKPAAPPPWSYQNQPIGTCTRDLSSGIPRTVCY